ncbi:MAG: WYL domain-containing protein [Erysipelotrichaceae bacterium]|jgi:hypothetical protein|nr:WYL domain-containing protein [Erysipelotrichaceae bacterium]
MLFNEVYSRYFKTVSLIIEKAQQGLLDDKSLFELVQKEAFSESVLELLPAIKSQDWLILDEALKTPLRHRPQMPLTLLEKRWLKSICNDPRVALFDLDTTDLKDVEPLFSLEDLYYYDRYEDGDDYQDATYQKHFRLLLAAIQEKRLVHISHCTRHRRVNTGVHGAALLEYSGKDDKFRLKTSRNIFINVARIIDCELLGPNPEAFTVHKESTKTVEFTLVDKRKALQRVMLHFSDLRKQTKRLGEDRYQCKLWYSPLDEIEIVIRILSFGPMIQVIGPQHFIALIQERLRKQRECLKESCEM